MAETEYQRYKRRNPLRARARDARQNAKRSPEYIKASVAKFKAENPERFAEQRRQAQRRYQATPEARRKRADRQARRRAQAAAPVDRFRVWFLGAGRCGICGMFVSLDGMHVDHVQPLVRGGAHEYDNMQPAHSVCNIRKGGR